jgi:GT2 family glycosyltransferase
MDAIKIAVLMTCYNRRDTTLACLRALMNQVEIQEVKLQVYLVDAGSNDGTAEAIEDQYPDIRLIRRDNTLFWCGGM